MRQSLLFWSFLAFCCEGHLQFLVFIAKWEVSCSSQWVRPCVLRLGWRVQSSCTWKCRAAYKLQEELILHTLCTSFPRMSLTGDDVANTFAWNLYQVTNCFFFFDNMKCGCANVRFQTYILSLHLNQLCQKTRSTQQKTVKQIPDFRRPEEHWETWTLCQVFIFSYRAWSATRVVVRNKTSQQANAMGTLKWRTDRFHFISVSSSLLWFLIWQRSGPYFLQLTMDVPPGLVLSSPPQGHIVAILIHKAVLFNVYENELLSIDLSIRHCLTFRCLKCFLLHGLPM